MICLAPYPVTGPASSDIPTVAAGSKAILRESVNAASGAGPYKHTTAKDGNATFQIHLPGASGSRGSGNGQSVPARNTHTQLTHNSI
jgi:hypothetical protein